VKPVSPIYFMIVLVMMATAVSVFGATPDRDHDIVPEDYFDLISLGNLAVSPDGKTASCGLFGAKGKTPFATPSTVLVFRKWTGRRTEKPSTSWAGTRLDAIRLPMTAAARSGALFRAKADPPP